MSRSKRHSALASPTFASQLPFRTLQAASFRLKRFSQRLESRSAAKCLGVLGIENVDSIPTYTTRQELVQLFKLAAECKYEANALEIGSYLGASTCYIAAGLAQRNGHLYCIDTWQNETMPDGERDTFREFRNNTSPIARYITPLRMRSDQLSEAQIPNFFDMIFIDADHSYRSVKQDFEFAARTAAHGAVICFHDSIAYEGVSRVIGEALACGRWMIAGQVENLLWIKRAEWAAGATS